MKLEDMPSWAQEIVCDQALGFLERGDARWDYSTPGGCLEIIIYLPSRFYSDTIYTYFVNKVTGRIY